MKKLAHGEELNRKRLQRKEKQTLAIMYWGLWQSVNQVDEYLATLQKKSEEKKALTAQLNFRKNVLKQKAAEQTDNLYAFSKNKKALTVVGIQSEEAHKSITARESTWQQQW